LSSDTVDEHVSLTQRTKRVLLVELYWLNCSHGRLVSFNMLICYGQRVSCLVLLCSVGDLITKSSSVSPFSFEMSIWAMTEAPSVNKPV